MSQTNGLRPSSTNPWWRTIIPGILIGLAVFLAYLPALHCGFVWDDDKYVTQNPLLTAPDGLWRIWFSLDSPSQYFPLTYTSFLVERQFWGLNATGYHLVNLLLQTANALLLWRLLLRLGVPGAWLAAAIFAIHPVQVESVVWITERKNVLMGFFFLLTLLAWVRSLDANNGRHRLHYAAALIFYMLALTAKTTACTAPAALLLILWLKKIPIDWRRLAQITPFVVLGLGMGLITIWWERFHQGTQGNLFALGPLERLLIASHAPWFYLGKLLWPVNLIFSYPRWKISATDLQVYFWPAATAILTLAIYRLRSLTGRGVEVAALFFIATLFPVLGFVMLYTFRYSFVADHYQYLACIGPIALISAGVVFITNKFGQGRRYLTGAVSAVLLFVLGTLTWQHCKTYANAETLWRTTLTRNPDCFMAYNNLGYRLYRKGQLDEAIELYRSAIALNPHDWEALNNLGVALADKRLPDEAVEIYRQAIAACPGNVEVLNNLGVALADKRQYPEAIQSYRQSCQINPHFAGAWNNLAWLLATCPDPQFRNGHEAVAAGEQACELTHFQEPRMIGTLAAAYAEAGRFSDATATAEKAEQLATRLGLTAVAEKNRQLINLYQAGKAYHETRNPEPARH